MIRSTVNKTLAGALACSLACAPLQAGADDIDIFTGASAGAKINPRILIVLDNTSNWSRQSQKWPGASQGQSEVNAIKRVVAELKDSVNVGMMEFVTGGSAGDNGGFIRYAVREMGATGTGATNKANFSAELTEIAAGINSPDEKRNANTPYGNLMYDVYNYFAGENAYSPAGVIASKADAGGYTTAWSKFASPLTNDNTCGKSYVIFIGNPGSSGPAADTPANSALLTALTNNRSAGGALIPVTQLGLPNFTTGKVSTPTTLGLTQGCYASPAEAMAGLTQYATECSGYTDGCKIGPVAAGAAGVCTGTDRQYEVIGTDTIITSTETGTYSTDTSPRNADEWARLLFERGVPVPGSSIRPSVSTYTIDVYNAQQSAEHTALMLSMAKAGGGKYYAARNEEAIVAALKNILIEISAVNATFASTSLPVNATNRSQNENQVFIGMFRPDEDAKPRWFGNLKRYQLINTKNGLDLGDAGGDGDGEGDGDGDGDDAGAINSNTGFVTPCARSYWTRDSGTYWKGLGIKPDPAGTCTVAGFDPYSDAPDGPFVEKGAAAQILRQGNVPAGGTTSFAVNRKMLTHTSAGLVDFSAANTSLDSNLVRYIRGEDVNNEKPGGANTQTRPSIHGDVIHSRPLPINYGVKDGEAATNGVTVFYGANDGTLRALNAETGVERWSFVAPEFFPRLSRLKSNSPLVAYPNLPDGISPAPTAKDYFFDGSTGVYQNADSSKVWIFPTMRRGGRMIYALDVSKNKLNAPEFIWKKGCPNLHDDVGCDTGMSGIGQTWSTPSVAFIKGYTAGPVLVVGGGYDRCEDANLANPTCTGRKGGAVYILDAAEGHIIRSFETEGSVAADISMVDIDNDAKPDYAYAADTRGNLYRIDFIAASDTRTALASSAWKSRKVAGTDGDGRKFLFAPALFAAQGHVYAALGSGDREHPLYAHYPYANVVNRFYVFKDKLPLSTDTETAPSADLDALADYTNANACDTAAVLPTNELKGWFMDLGQNGQGEQVVTSALIAGGMVTFSTNRPFEPRVGSCSTTLGEARGYWVNLLNAAGAINSAGTCGGRRSSVFVGGGLPPSPVLANGVMVGGKATTVVIGAVQKGFVGATGASVAIAPQRVRPAITSKRKRTYSYTSGAD
ncbi:pilus assembly protein [Massilia niabensis]|uniref:Pilus assembly protein n=1 Tax=Massilia niabensis TaxID=544910 RepID=A0ABW0L977_9BURK